MRTLTTLLFASLTSLSLAHCAHEHEMRALDETTAQLACADVQPVARGGGPVIVTQQTEVPVVRRGVISLGTVESPENITPVARGGGPATSPRAQSTTAQQRAYESVWTTPPPVVISDGPTNTLGGSGSAFTIGPQASPSGR